MLTAVGKCVLEQVAWECTVLLPAWLTMRGGHALALSGGQISKADDVTVGGSASRDLLFACMISKPKNRCAERDSFREGP